MENNIIEMAVFKVQEEVTDKQVIELSNAFIEVLKREMIGFIKRVITKDHKQDRWVELVWWESMEAAQTAFKKAPLIPEFQAYCSVMIEDDSDLVYLEEKEWMKK